MIQTANTTVDNSCLSLAISFAPRQIRLDSIYLPHLIRVPG